MKLKSIDKNGLTLSLLLFCRWLNCVRLSLVAAMDVVESISLDRSPVIIQETGGRDFVLVVGSLAQLILDSFYRTIRGFQTLIQKMWVLGGHQFLQRVTFIEILSAILKTTSRGVKRKIIAFWTTHFPAFTMF